MAESENIFLTEKASSREISSINKNLTQLKKAREVRKWNPVFLLR